MQSSIVSIDDRNYRVYVLTNESIIQHHQLNASDPLTLTRSLYPQRLTHFLSLPIGIFNLEQLSHQYEQFQKDIFLHEKLPKDIFTHIEKLHFTLFVLTLKNKEETQSAIDLMKSIEVEVKEREFFTPLVQFELKGLRIMKGSVNGAFVLYIDLVDSHCSVQKFCDFVQQKFLHSGFQISSSPIKVHCTLINTRYLSEGRFKYQYKHLISHGVRAKRLIKEYHDVSFGRIELKECHLSCFNSKVSDTGYYSSEYKFPLQACI